MRKYVIRRILYAIPTLLGISVIVFAISRLAPGDPVRLYTFGAEINKCRKHSEQGKDKMR